MTTALTHFDASATRVWQDTFTALDASTHALDAVALLDMLDVELPAQWAAAGGVEVDATAALAALRTLPASRDAVLAFWTRAVLVEAGYGDVALAVVVDDAD